MGVTSIRLMISGGRCAHGSMDLHYLSLIRLLLNTLVTAVDSHETKILRLQCDTGVTGSLQKLRRNEVDLGCSRRSYCTASNDEPTGCPPVGS